MLIIAIITVINNRYTIFVTMIILWKWQSKMIYEG